MEVHNATWRQEMMWGNGMNTTYMGKETTCYINPHIMLYSHGVWEKMDAEGMAFWEYPIPKLQIVILFIYVLWQLFDLTFKKLGVPIPKFTSMMLAGVVLSHAFHAIQMSWFQHIFSPDSFLLNVAENIGLFGFILDWFLRGVTTDTGTMKRSKTKSLVIGLTSMIFPWYIGQYFHTYREKSSILTMKAGEYIIVIVAMNMTPFTCINMLLTDLKVVHMEFGLIAQSAAMATDMLAFGATIAAYFMRSYHLGMHMGGFLLLFLAFLYLLRQAMFWVIRHTPEGVPVKNIYLYIVLILAYLSYLYWNQFLYFGPMGAFFLGLAIPHGPPLGSVFIEKFDSFNEGVLLPLFGALTMSRLDWSFLLGESGNAKLRNAYVYECLSHIFVLYVTKFMSTFLAALATKMPLRDSVILGIIMGTKSNFELAYILYAFEAKRVGTEVFTVVGVYILANSMVTPVVLHFLHDRSRKFYNFGKRNLKHKPELDMLVCINKPDNITSMINLLRAISPSKDSPAACCVLHLIELVGQATPMFISHQLQKPKRGTQSYSEHVLSAFKRFQEAYKDYTSIQMFTSLAPAKEMDEHISRFALDKGLNLILLPFHRTWADNGTRISSDDQNLRSLNFDVMRRAPCSVGILVHRKPIWHTNSAESPCRVCLVYVGGNDDKEASALADHMKGNEKVKLTVLRLTPTYDDERQRWSESKMVQMKRDVERPKDNSILYIDLAVGDGNETSDILRSMAHDYDLFIVGRSCGIDTVVTEGLEAWMEFGELGIIGDLLSSDYFPSKASVLVVQQQE